MQDERKWIKEGMAVAHKDYTSLKMRVERIVKRSVNVVNGKEDKRVKFIVGVKCHWFDNTGNDRTKIFHTGELLPYDIAQLSQEEIIEWCENH